MKSTVFITGTGRCGTNVLKNILSEHSYVASLPFEQRFTIDPDGIFDFYRSRNSWSPFIADRRIKRLGSFLKTLAKKGLNQDSAEASSIIKGPYQDWELDKWIPGYSDYVNELLEEIIEFSYEGKYPGKTQNDQMLYPSKSNLKIRDALTAFQENCNSSILKDRGRKVLVEDNTWSFLFAKEALELTPNSFLIHMIRDPRDVISSMKDQRWTPNALEDLVQYYKDLIAVWNVQKSKIGIDQFVEIRFEDFIDTPKEQLMEICELIGISFEPKMLELDLSKSNIGRYTSTFNEEEVEYIDSSLSDILSDYKYN